MISPCLRRLPASLRKTRLKPHWLVLKNTVYNKSAIGRRIKGRLLDIGCGNKPLQTRLSPNVESIGLDYQTTVAKGHFKKLA